MAVALGICVVPCLYAWVNLIASWDPYENTSDISVAVVNQDQAVEVDGIGSLCTGDMMMDALKENDKIGWRFVEEDEAMRGVRAGDYYAAIILPSDFTESLTAVLKGEVRKANLDYYVNEKVNSIAPKITDTGASTIETQIGEQFVATVGKVVAEKTNDLADKLHSDVGNVTENVGKALDEARTNIDEVGGKIDGLSASLQNAQASLNEAADKLDKLQGKGASTAEALGATIDNLTQTRTNASNLMSDINTALGEGASTISALSSQANYDVSAIVGDVSTAQSQVEAAIRALENDLTDDQALVSEISGSRDLLLSVQPTTERGIALQLDLQNSLNNEFDFMTQINDQQAAKIDELRGIVQRLQSAADEVGNVSNDINGRVQGATGTIQNAQTGTVGSTLNQIHAAIDTFMGVAQELKATMGQVDPIISQTISITRDLANSVGKTDEALGKTGASIDSLSQTVEGLSEDLAAIRASKAWELVQNATKANPEAVHDFLTEPVDVNERALYPVANYASGVAPFFTSLALWVGGIALVAIFKLEVDEEDVGQLRPWQAYFGRWMLFVLLGILQAIICCTGDLIIGIQCIEPWAFYLSAIVASFAFVNIIFGLSVAFKHLGKALAFTITILQVPGSSGMYPIEMMPPFFQAIGPWLPFTYSNNAMREAIAGFYNGNLAYNLLMLLLFVLPSILVGVTARSRLINLNALLDRRLRETDHLMVSENVAIEGNRYRLATLVKVIRAPEEYREVAEERIGAFERAYPALVRRGVLVLLLLPLVLFGLTLVLDAKLPLIGALVAAVILIYVYLLVIEYFHDRIENKRTLCDMSPDELEVILADTLRNEWMPYAPIDKIIERRRAKRDSGKRGPGRRGRHRSRRHGRHAGTEPDVDAPETMMDGGASGEAFADGSDGWDGAADGWDGAADGMADGWDGTPEDGFDADGWDGASEEGDVR